MIDDLFAPMPAPVVESPQAAVPYTWSEEHRHACEVRYVKALSFSARREYIEGVAKKRGQAAASRLREGAAGGR